MSNVLKTLTMAKMLIQKAQKKQKDVYDLKHSLPNSFSIGEFVLIKKTLNENRGLEGNWKHSMWSLHDNEDSWERIL